MPIDPDSIALGGPIAIAIGWAGTKLAAAVTRIYNDRKEAQREILKYQRDRDDSSNRQQAALLELVQGLPGVLDAHKAGIVRELTEEIRRLDRESFREYQRPEPRIQRRQYPPEDRGRQDLNEGETGERWYRGG